MGKLQNSVILPLCLAAACNCGCGRSVTVKTQDSQKEKSDLILIDQVGYAPTASKIALIRTAAGQFDIVDTKTGKTVFTGETGKPEYWQYSGDTVRTADFTSVVTPGKYRICIKDKDICSFDFSIGNHLYSDVVRASVKALYLNRSGFPITEEFGGKWARPEGHPDTVVLVHESAASKTRPAGTVISSPGGWYDAGDYNKYIVNSAISVYTMLLAYQLYPEYCDTLTIDIPEKNNDLPDAIDEILFNLRWMLTMQDPGDGGVYHKLTNKEFGGFIMPDQATTPRYVVQKTTAASLDFAASMAMASRVFANDKHDELKKLSPVCLEAAVKAMKWAEANPDVAYRQPSDIKTGEYGGSDNRDELFWAKTELALAENNLAGVDPAALALRKPMTQAWGDVEMLGIFSLALSDNPAFESAQKAAATVLVRSADILLEKSNTSAYHVSLDFFKWGSNSDVANQAMTQILALRLTGDNKYTSSIQGNIDYLLGRNATGYCFITGIGSKPPMNLHHRPSGADGVAEPYPGFLVGGPNTVVINDCKGLVKRSTFPAASYADSECSYSTNEIAINWNAALFFVLAAVDAGE